MEAALTNLTRNYKMLVGESREYPLMNSWPLMSSPYPVLGIAAAYLLFVLALGPRVMRNRKPFDLTFVITGYNAYQVLFSLWLATLPIRHRELLDFRGRGCTPVEVAAIPYAITHASWWYFASKIVELLDTIFFVLRKKQSQVTFLHVYHHSALVVLSWGFLKYVFVEHGIVVVVVNSLVHVVMYAYYLLAAMGPAVRKHLWWKKYITAIQLIQFIVLLTYVVSLVAYDCQLPKSVILFAGGNLVIFLFLFGRFYRRAYRKVTPRDANLPVETLRKPVVSARSAVLGHTNYYPSIDLFGLSPCSDKDGNGFKVE